MEKILQISKEKRIQVLKWLAKNSSLEVLLIIFSEKKNQFFKCKDKCKDYTEADVIAFLKALEIIYDEQKLLDIKNKTMNFSSIERATNIKYQNSHNSNKEKWDFLLNHKSVILNMRNDENLSLRKISSELVKRKYIKKNTFKYNNEQSISHTQIQKFINCVEGKDA